MITVGKPILDRSEIYVAISVMMAFPKIHAVCLYILKRTLSSVGLKRRDRFTEDFIRDAFLVPFSIYKYPL